MPELEIKGFPVANLPHVKGSQFASIYANNVGLAAGFYDVMLMFGHVVPNYDNLNDQPHIEDTASIMMSWEHAKALATALNKTIDNYEKDNGPIRTPPMPPVTPTAPIV